MAKRRPLSLDTSSRRTLHHVDIAAEDTSVRLSFKWLDTEHPTFSHREDGMAVAELLEGLRWICMLNVQALHNEWTWSRTHCHPIIWKETAHPNGFGVDGAEDLEEYAWQFSVRHDSLHDHEAGRCRVHGFLIENTFYIRWFDAKHALYPGTPPRS